MSEEAPRSRVIVLVVLSLAAAMVVAGFPAIKWAYERRLHSLFLGPTEETQPVTRPGAYRGVYPIKVNKQSHVVQQLLAYVREFHLGLEVGSKPEMLVN